MIGPWRLGTLELLIDGTTFAGGYREYNRETTITEHRREEKVGRQESGSLQLSVIEAQRSTEKHLCMATTLDSRPRGQLLWQLNGEGCGSRRAQVWRSLEASHRILSVGLSYRPLCHRVKPIRRRLLAKACWLASRSHAPVESR